MLAKNGIWIIMAFASLVVNILYGFQAHYHLTLRVCCSQRAKHEQRYNSSFQKQSQNSSDYLRAPSTDWSISSSSESLRWSGARGRPKSPGGWWFILDDKEFPLDFRRRLLEYWERLLQVLWRNPTADRSVSLEERSTDKKSLSSTRVVIFRLFNRGLFRACLDWVQSKLSR